MRVKIELCEVRSESIKLEERWKDVFSVSVLIGGRLETFKSELKLNLIKELQNRYSPALYDYSCLYSYYSRTPKERKF